MEWKEELNNRYEKVLIGEKDGVKFEVILPSYGKSYIVFADDTEAGFASRKFENIEKWCEEFEYCHECGEHPVHADKLCHGCYFK